MNSLVVPVGRCFDALDVDLDVVVALLEPVNLALLHVDDAVHRTLLLPIRLLLRLDVVHVIFKHLSLKEDGNGPCKSKDKVV